MAGRRPTARDRRARTDQERARIADARRRVHDRTVSRRVRDNIIAVVVGSVIVIGAIVSQVVHAQVTAAEPSPSPTSTAEP